MADLVCIADDFSNLAFGQTEFCQRLYLLNQLIALRLLVLCQTRALGDRPNAPARITTRFRLVRGADTRQLLCSELAVWGISSRCEQKLLLLLLLPKLLP